MKLKILHQTSHVILIDKQNCVIALYSICSAIRMPLVCTLYDYILHDQHTHTHIYKYEALSNDLK